MYSGVQNTNTTCLLNKTRQFSSFSYHGTTNIVPLIYNIYILFTGKSLAASEKASIGTNKILCVLYYEHKKQFVGACLDLQVLE